MSQPKDRSRSSQVLQQVVLLLLLFGYWLIAWSLERVDYSQLLPPFWSRLVNLFPLLNLFRPIIVFASEMLSVSVLRHFIPVIVGWFLAYMASYRLVASFYDLPDMNKARSLLARLRGSIFAPGVKASINRDQFEADRSKNALLQVGGPGKISVGRGDAVVTECNGRFSRVLGPGSHNLNRFEYPMAVIDLRPQEREKESVEVVTGDGISATTTVAAAFQIDPGQDVPTSDEPFPFDEDAVRQLSYGQSNLGDDKFSNWDSLPLIVASGQVADVVSQSKLDELVVIDEASYKIHQRLKTEVERRARASLRRFGILLRTIRLGHFSFPDPVKQQRLDIWKSHWERELRMRQELGEAEARDIEEMARAQAEALMLQAIAEGLQRVRQSGQGVAPKTIIALRLVEALETMVRQSQEVTPVPVTIQSSLNNLQKHLQGDDQGMSGG